VAAAFLFLSSGLFLGWSLGANDAANVFGTAVGTRMLRFATAATICSVFVILGAVVSGTGASHTLGKLGTVNAIPGAFTVALSAAVTVYSMVKIGVPVSTTQAIVGAIVGWNLFSGSPTDTDTLFVLVSTWLIGPSLAAVVAGLLYWGLKGALRRMKLHLLRLDAYTRAGLILAGAFGAYSLGANNIANVMGVFVPVSPFTPFTIDGLWTVSSTQQLFLLGGLAIAAGVITYSKRVMLTVGRDLMPMSPVAAFVVVVAHSIVLFLFASRGLERLLASAGLPTIPLVPVSSSQAVIGAVIGIGLVQGGRRIRYRLLAGIAGGWVTTPIIAGVICFFALFFLQNVFDQEVYKPRSFALSDEVLTRAAEDGVVAPPLWEIAGQRFESARAFTDAVRQRADLPSGALRRLADLAEATPLTVDLRRLARLDEDFLSPEERAALDQLDGRRFAHRWRFDDALARLGDAWKPRPDTPANKMFNRKRREKLQALYDLFANPA